MTNLISRRVVEGAWGVSRQMNSRLSSRFVSAGIENETALEEWEAEGGASADPQHAAARALAEIEHV